ncbi:hypothetical protein SLEP1_g47102 [Rubroshorea leprosula]|uniref:Uncharacterized protein n=1 Tax=Rubroshorea leprosula TaxID=152421 RepID=A0AAV5LRY0_9ROSI|nr:hypothetical protein SLEP1_g47102 [Rubroshorea leprosula]
MTVDACLRAWSLISGSKIQHVLCWKVGGAETAKAFSKSILI